jgi:tRNA-dihydrouridine synthase C
MLGRGAVADPLLARRIRNGGEHATAADWQEVQGMIAEFWARVQTKLNPQQSPGRLKQWLGMMQRSYPQAERLFREIREARGAPEVSAGLQRSDPRHCATLMS